MYPNVRQFESYDVTRLRETHRVYDYEDDRSALRRIVLAVVGLLGLMTVIWLIALV